MKIDKPLCNKILQYLLEDYPSNMSSESWSKAVEGETDIKHVAAQFKYLEEKGYIQTRIDEDDEDGKLIFNIALPLTSINSYGIDFIEAGGFS